MMILAKEKQLNKIVVRFPNWLGDIIMSFPFMSALKQEFPHDEIHVIVKPHFADVVKLLPFPVTIHHFDKKLHGTKPNKIKKYCLTTKELFDADLFFTLPPSFSSAFMGHTFGAKEIIGYRGQLRDLILTRGYIRQEGDHRSEEYMYLLRNYLGKEIATPRISAQIDLSSPRIIEGEYLVVNVNSEASSRRVPPEKWVELLTQFKNQTFVFIGMKKEQERVTKILEMLPEDSNSYIDLSGKTTVVELAGLFKHSRGLLSNDSGPAHLAAFAGTPVVVFFGAGNEQSTAPNYLRSPVLIIKDNCACSPCLQNKCPLQTLDCLNKIDMCETYKKVSAFLESSSSEK